ncbi:probable ribonuclease ZC3H12D [Monodelphis domestica]|uniref:Zinc finger CCCH-type containing 12D n=1 Tax=Monodelphis domestica TaxID=13616 RepID=A0A5F8H4G0_MONDO|nr:probable ribonuclease ZC3H12D [Monodelphis domestica]
MEPHTEKLEFFRKLGYGQDDVVRVLAKLGQGALVNDILQELIQMGSRPQTEESCGESPAPKLVSRGCGGSMDSSRQLLGMDPDEELEDPANHLRPIVIDGSNVAMSHGNKETFSCRGIRLAVDWFRERGHNYIKVFVPSWRKEPPRSETPISEQHILEEMEKQAVLVYTPSRKVNGKRVVCYDDRYIVKVAYEKDGVIVSNDNYRDLQSENPEWKWFIEQRLLMFSFVNDKFMPPDDPLGRHGPTLSNFLSKKPKLPQPSWQHCPYGRKCTYGVKCKFYHPERLHQIQLSVADELRAKTRTLPGSEDEQQRASLLHSGPVPSVPRCSPRTEGLWNVGGSVSGYSNGSPSSAGWTEERVPSLDGSLEKPDPESGLPLSCPAGALRLLEAQFSRLAFRDGWYGRGLQSGVRVAEIQSEMNGLSQGGHLNHSSCHSRFEPHRISMACSCLQNDHLQEDAAVLTPYVSRHPAVGGSYCNGSRESNPAPEKTFAPRNPPSKGNLQQAVYHSSPSRRDLFPHPSQPNETWGLGQVLKQPPAPSFWGGSGWGNCPFRRAGGYPCASEYDYLSSDSASGERAHVRTTLYNIFPQDEVDQVMSSFPNLVDINSLILLIQKNRRLFL